MASETPTPRYTIQGREVRFPVEVRDASSGAAAFAVPAAAAEALLPGDEFEVATIAPGTGLLTLAAIDYRDNDLGDYNEVSIALFVRPRGSGGIPYLGTFVDLVRSRLGTYILHLPVDQAFTCEAGCTIWGFPKSVQQIDIDYAPDRIRCALDVEGQRALRLSLPRRASRDMPEQQLTTYSHIQGVAHATTFRSRSEGMGMSFGGAEVELGSGPIAEQLRSLGLPRRALFCSWMEHMHAVFEPPRKL